MCNFYFNIIPAGFGGSPYLELTIVGNTTRMVMQQAILALHCLLQDICGLIDDLTQASSDSKQTLQCIYALCDGTEQSVANVPDVQMFASNGTGIVNNSLVYQHVQLHLLV